MESVCTFFTCGVEINGFEQVVHCLGAAQQQRVLHMVVVVELMYTADPLVRRVGRGLSIRANVKPHLRGRPSRLHCCFSNTARPSLSPCHSYSCLFKTVLASLRCVVPRQLVLMILY
jgi:hypothetical protein